MQKTTPQCKCVHFWPLRWLISIVPVGGVRHLDPSLEPLWILTSAWPYSLHYTQIRTECLKWTGLMVCASASFRLPLFMLSSTEHGDRKVASINTSENIDRQ